MDFSKACKNLRSIYDLLNSEFIRTDFTYQKHHIYLYYLRPDSHRDMIHLFISGTSKAGKYSVFCNFALVSSASGAIWLNPFFPNKEYKALRDNLFAKDGYSPTPLFEHIRSQTELAAISDFVACEYGSIDKHRSSATIHTNNASVAKSYFQTTRIANISEEMIRRIQSEFIQANEIISFLRQTRRTLVFTNDYSRRRDFYVYMANEFDFKL